MFRTFLMTVLAMVAIGFDVGSTAEAGGVFSRCGGGGYNTGSKKLAGVTVYHRCWDDATVYVMWLPSGSTVDPRDPALSLNDLMDMGARPVNFYFIMGTTIPDLAPGDGVLWAFDGNGGSFKSLPATIVPGCGSNIFKLNGWTNDPAVSWY